MVEMLARGPDSPPGNASKELPYRYARRVEMSPEEWAKIPVNPIQRDTEFHAKRASHLLNYSPEHAIVKMAVLPNGSLYKLDGHTRSFLWETGAIIPPRRLLVDVFECVDLKAVEALYEHYDNRAAAESGQDMLSGAARKAGLVFETPMLKYGQFGSALNMLYGMTYKEWGGRRLPLNHDTAFTALMAYREELIMFDSVRPTKTRFPLGIVMATLATFKRRGAKVLPFWQLYSEDRGVKDGVHCDAVQALIDAVTGARRFRGTANADRQEGLFNKAVVALEAYPQQKYLVGTGGGVRMMKEANLKAYLRAHLPKEKSTNVDLPALPRKPRF